MSNVEAVSENNSYRKLNTCPVCQHYDWNHTLDGCQSLAYFKEERTIKQCECKVPYGGASPC